MIKKIRTLNAKTLELTIQHPLSEMGDVPLFVTFFAERNEFIFSLPHHRWSYIIPRNQRIELDIGPGPFHHSDLKKKLVQTMNEAVCILENVKR